MTREETGSPGMTSDAAYAAAVDSGAHDRPAGPVEPVLPVTSRGRWLVIGVLALALLLRFGVAWHEHSTYVPQTDARQFDAIGQSIANGDGFGQAPQPPMIGPTALRAPLYPLALGVVYTVVGHSTTAGLLLNAVLGVAVVALVGLLGSQLLGRRVGFVALALAAVHPAMIMTGSGLQLEPMLTALTLGGLVAALEHRRAPRRLVWPIVAGVCLGLAVLTRELAFFFIIPSAWLVWTAKGRRPSLKDRKLLVAPLLVLVLPVVVVLPWTARNQVQLDAFVPVTTSAGFGLVGTYNATSEADTNHPGQWIPPYQDPAIADRLLNFDNPTEVRVDRALRRMAIDLVKDHPGYPLKVAVWNTIRGFDLDGGTYTKFIAPFLPYPHWILNLALLASWMVLAAAAIGAFTRRARSVPLAVWIIPVVSVLFMVVFLPFSIRYRASLEPFLLLLVSSALITAFDRWWPGVQRAEATETPAAAG
jgi:4-amino-4-deoxy-L-arabinose transferase-like glycosyltransferase